MSDRSSGQAPSRLVAVLGPTNTGKTHFAVERMLGHASGMIGLPLRLLAREIYDRVVKLRGARGVALITGEEKIVPPRALYFVCTVEAMPLNREVEFLAVDEIQLCADPARGHVFTQRLLHARGRVETLFLGASTMAPLIRRLLPGCEFITRERFSALTYAGPKKLTKLPRRSAIVAFSGENVYAIAELIRRQRGGAAVVMGSLSPRTRNAQVALYQSGEVDFLVATDAIGMGLNMDVDHVAFAGLRKFDGKRTRWLSPQEVGQIAGRAGRYRKDGTFGVTGEAEAMDEELVATVQDHAYEAIAEVEWRNPRLDFDSLPALIRSLAAPPMMDGLKLAEEALDERTLRALAADPEVADKAVRRDWLHRLWEVCQTPDFRKTTFDEHLRLVRAVFEHLTGRGLAATRLSDDWIEGQFRALDHAEGEIEVLAQRLAGVRTLAYAANRPDWLRDPAEWQRRTKGLEEKLSDTLHARLMQRFIDRRTSALMRGLSRSEAPLAGVASDGTVTVEGHAVGRLAGVAFDPERGATALESKTLRRAAERVVAPEIARRLGALAADPDDAFALLPDGQISWRGHAAGALTGGRPFAPRVRLYGEAGAAPGGIDGTHRRRAERRLEAFVAAESSRVLAALKGLEAAVADGALKGLSRGIAYRLAEAGGVLPREAVGADVGQLSQAERRALRSLGVRFGAFSLFLPALLSEDARALLAAFARIDAPHWSPSRERPSPLPSPPPPAAALAALGLRACGRFAVPVLALERLDALLRAAPKEVGAVALTEEARAELGWSEAEASAILRALGYAPARRPEPGKPILWRRRREAPREPAPKPIAPEGSPFAALAALTLAPPKRARRRARRVRAGAATRR